MQIQAHGESVVVGQSHCSSHNQSTNKQTYFTYYYYALWKCQVGEKKHGQQKYNNQIEKWNVLSNAAVGPKEKITISFRIWFANVIVILMNVRQNIKNSRALRVQSGKLLMRCNLFYCWTVLFLSTLFASFARTMCDLNLENDEEEYRIQITVYSPLARLKSVWRVKRELLEWLSLPHKLFHSICLIHLFCGKRWKMNVLWMVESESESVM